MNMQSCLDSHILNVCLWVAKLPSRQLTWVWVSDDECGDICKLEMLVSPDTEDQAQVANLKKISGTGILVC